MGVLLVAEFGVSRDHIGHSHEPPSGFLTVTSQSQTFTSSNWNVRQLVTFNLIDNQVDEGGIKQVRKLAIDLTASGTGSDYEGYPLVWFTVNVWNEDIAGIILSPTTLTMTEEDVASYKVKLATEPTSSVMVEITGQAATDLSLDKLSLTFTTTKWSTAQTVTVATPTTRRY